MPRKLDDQHPMVRRELGRDRAPVASIPADAVHEDDGGFAGAQLLNGERRPLVRKNGSGRGCGKRDRGNGKQRSKCGAHRESIHRPAAEVQRAGSASRCTAYAEAWSVGMSRISWTFTCAGRVTAQATASATSSAVRGRTPR